MTETAFHLIQHPFAQGAGRQAQFSDFQCVKQTTQNCQTRHKHFFAIVRQAR
ncbi:Uncharacterised protein [Klebsiella pneumoniae]|nr:Uncharacterised protein [Klebsiella pneumoniae]